MRCSAVQLVLTYLKLTGTHIKKGVFPFMTKGLRIFLGINNKITTIRICGVQRNHNGKDLTF